MADKKPIRRLAGVMALAMTAPLTLMIAPAGAATATARPFSSPAQFTVPRGPVLAGRAAMFDAAASRAGGTVTGFGWTLSGPGVAARHFTATCSANTSQMQTSFARRGVMRVTLQVSYASGTVATATHTIAIRAAAVRPIAKPMTGQATQWLLCHRGPTDPAVQPVGNGGPPAGCQDQYFDGSIDAIGCLSVLPSYNKIPAPERTMLCPIIKCATSRTPVVPQLLPVLSAHTVRLNGIDITPAAALVLDQNDGWLASPSATASLLHRLLPVSTGKLLHPVYTRPLFTANLTQLLARYPALATALNLSFFQVSGKLTATLTRYTSAIHASITLPTRYFSGSGGKPVTSSVLLTAANQTGLVLDDVLIAVPIADFGGTLELDHLAFCYQRHISEQFCQQRTGASFGPYEGTDASSWNAVGQVNIPGPPIDPALPPAEPQADIGFVNGQLAYGRADGVFSPPLPLGTTGLSMSSLQASLALNPTSLNGSIGMTAGRLVSINGRLLLVFASPSQPYTFTPCATGMPAPTAHAFAVAVCGTVGFMLPVVGTTSLAGGYVLYLYQSPGNAAVGGNINISILNGNLIVNGDLNGHASLDGDTFDLAGEVTVQAFGLTIYGTVDVSNTGITFCGTPSPPNGPPAGVEYPWGGSITVTEGTCPSQPVGAIANRQTVHPSEALTGQRI